MKPIRLRMYLRANAAEYIEGCAVEHRIEFVVDQLAKENAALFGDRAYRDARLTIHLSPEMAALLDTKELQLVEVCISPIEKDAPPRPQPMATPPDS